MSSLQYRATGQCLLRAFPNKPRSSVAVQYNNAYIYQCVYIIDYFYQDFIYASDNLAYLCGLQPEQLMEAGYQIYIDHVPENDLQMLLEVNKKGDAGPTTKEVFKYLKGKAFGSGKTKRILNKEFDIGKSIVIP